MFIIDYFYDPATPDFAYWGCVDNETGEVICQYDETIHHNFTDFYRCCLSTLDDQGKLDYKNLTKCIELSDAARLMQALEVECGGIHMDTWTGNV